MDKRISSKMEIAESGCWLWMACRDKDGYGMVGIDGKTRRAHRAAYEFRYGTMPAGLVVDHLCRIPACVNPDHMEAVTSRINTLRGMSPPARLAKATHCKHGHEFTTLNTYVRTDGSRQCRQCMNRAGREWRARQRAIA